MKGRRGAVAAGLLAVLLGGLAATAGQALEPPAPDPLRELEVRHPHLWFVEVYRPLAELPPGLAAWLEGELHLLGVTPEHAFFDLRTGRWGTLIITRPLIPGPGAGNELRWSDLGRQAPRDAEERLQAAWEAFQGFLAEHAAELPLDLAELGPPTLTSHGERLIQIHAGRQRDGIPVRDAHLTAAVNSGNLVLMGLRNWGDLALETAPSQPSEAAEETLRQYLGELAHTRLRQRPRLEIVPVSSEPDDTLVEPGAGLSFRLVWVLAPHFEDHLGIWEAVVDAHSGELLAFEDLNHYVSRRIGGGIYPVSNDGLPPDGVEQPGYPMPFANVAVDGTPIGFTTTGGNVPPSAETGTISTTLAGQFARISDNCGAVNESAPVGDIDLGDGPGTDCAVPPGGSPGNTHSTRTTFYELNRIIEQAQGYLPDNAWLQQQLRANMNINDNCNAFWNGTVNFFTSGGGCANTGEIAAVVDHEWGHGMDANDGAPGVSRPGEGIADIFAQNRLNDSCIGRGFRPGSDCGGFGDPCLDCTGVRESDWAKRQSGQPHDISWVIASCPGFGNTPCGKSTHCEGTIVAEAVWDLVHRDLRGFDGSPFDFDLNTALELGTRLTYYGSHTVVSWFQCNPPNGGCNADGGYLNYLAADDDNGDLTDGTPHMSAIFAAFDRHQLACPAPVVQDSGCAGGPGNAPANLTVTPINEGAHLAWDPVPGAGEYWIYRTEGVHGCDFGKSRVATTTATEITKLGLRNGFEVLYSVVAVGDDDACTSPMSACAAVTPESGPSGVVAGMVTHAWTSAPVAGVQVVATGPVILGSLTQADGSYEITVPVGTYDVTASKAGFQASVVADVEVEEDETVTVDFVLEPEPAPMAAVSPESFDFGVPQGGRGADVMDIGNIGTLDLEWLITTDVPPSLLGSALGGSLGSADFEGDFHIDNWTFENNPPGTGGSFNTNPGPPVELFLVGGNSGVQGDTDLWIQIPQDGEITFDWGYQSSDIGDWDQGGYILNGVFTQLADNASQVPYFQGFVTVNVSQGDIFGFRVHTRDGLFGAGTLGVTNFQFDPDICRDPVTVEWLSVDPPAGVTPPAGGVPVDVLVDATGLDEGAYEAVLCVGTNDPTQPLVVVPVTLTVEEAAPIADISPSSFELEVLEGDGGGATLDAGNAGTADLDWSIDLAEPGDGCASPAAVGWLGVVPDAGTTEPGEIQPVNVVVDSTGLEAGDHEALLCVTTNDPEAELVVVPVSLTVLELCPDGGQLLLQDMTVDGTELFEACVAITAGPDFTITSTGNVTLRAGQRIVLSSGLVVETGGSFTAEVDPELLP